MKQSKSGLCNHVLKGIRVTLLDNYISLSRDIAIGISHIYLQRGENDLSRNLDHPSKRLTGFQFWPIIFVCSQLSCGVITLLIQGRQYII